jgi:hypothetical protein
MGSPGSRGCILVENMPFIRFSVNLHSQDPYPPAVVGSILDVSGLATIFTRLEFAGLLYLACFASEVQETPYANLTALHPSIATEWDQLEAEYIRKTCCHSATASKPLLRKMHFKFSRCAQSMSTSTF